MGGFHRAEIGAAAMYLPDRLPLFGKAYVVEVDTARQPPSVIVQAFLDDVSVEALAEAGIFDGFEYEEPDSALDEVTGELRLRLRPEVAEAHAELLCAAADPAADLLSMRGPDDPRPPLSWIADYELEEWTMRTRWSPLRPAPPE